MSSFFGRLKSNQGPSNSSATSPTKGKLNNVVLSPLEQILADTRPIRQDGNDKFFGMNNPSNTCYCNSVLQCLYFSEAFRQHVVGYPTELAAVKAIDMPSSRTSSDFDSTITALPQSATPGETPSSTPFMNGHAVAPQQTPRLAPVISANPIATASESKETFDTRKKAIMAAGPHLRMQQARFDQYGMPESLFTSLKDMFDEVITTQSRMGVIVPTRFIEVLRENFTYFKEPIHHDAHEFLNLLLNDVVEQVEKHTRKLAAGTHELARTEKALNGSISASSQAKAWVHDLFEGTLTSETRCLTCENVSQRDEVFLDLSVDLEEHTSVTSCLSRFSEEEMLCEKNKFQCEKCCSLQEAEKRMKIKRLPKILALHLKRFKWFDNALRKLFDRVVFPFYLRIQNTTEDAEDPDRLYELYAVIVHLGSTPHHGHYVSIIKTKDRGWLLFDDELVLPVDASYVRRYFGGDPRNSACAYVLFYQETTEDAIVREQDVEDPYGREAFTATIREDIPGSSSPTEEAGSPFDSLPAALKTPTTEVPLTLKTPTAEDESFMAHLENPTSRDTPASPRPPSGYMSRLSGEMPFLTSGDPSARPSERQSLDKIPTVISGEEQKPNDKPVVPVDSKKRHILGSGSISRFRTPSLSLKSKPKLFSKHERADSSRDAHNHADGDGMAVEEKASGEPEPLKSMKHKASLFALGRKKSGNLL